MSVAYRVEREVMFVGGGPPTFRVIVKLHGDAWGKVQGGLSKQDADDLCLRLLDNEMRKREAVQPRTGKRR
jgi:hypothetical protein